MARPRKGVSFENANQIGNFFSKALNDYKRQDPLLIDSSMSFEAQKELVSIQELQYCDIEEPYKDTHLKYYLFD